MTRANINFIWQEQGEAPRTLFFYWNGDQYPQGIRDHYNILDLFAGEVDAAAFKNWARKNYDGVEIRDLGAGGQPKIYYTDGFITDYSYAIEARGTVKVWNWDKLIFSGDFKKFASWLKRQK